MSVNRKTGNISFSEFNNANRRKKSMKYSSKKKRFWYLLV